MGVEELSSNSDFFDAFISVLLVELYDLLKNIVPDEKRLASVYDKLSATLSNKPLEDILELSFSEVLD
mgnify:CR=1 FL=1